MAVYDLTLTLSPDLVVWEDDTLIEIDVVSRLDRGDICHLSNIKMSAHSGTHVDAPMHFLSDGKGVESLDLDAMMGPVQLVDVRGHECITRSILSTLNFAK